MKKYVKPVIEILLFDEADCITASGEPTARMAVTKQNDALVDVNITIPMITEIGD